MHLPLTGIPAVSYSRTIPSLQLWGLTKGNLGPPALITISIHLINDCSARKGEFDQSAWYRLFCILLGSSNGWTHTHRAKLNTNVERNQSDGRVQQKALCIEYICQGNKTFYK